MKICNWDTLVVDEIGVLGFVDRKFGQGGAVVYSFNSEVGVGLEGDVVVDWVVD